MDQEPPGKGKPFIRLKPHRTDLEFLEIVLSQVIVSCLNHVGGFQKVATVETGQTVEGVIQELEYKHAKTRCRRTPKIEVIPWVKR